MWPYRTCEKSSRSPERFLLSACFPHSHRGSHFSRCQLHDCQTLHKSSRPAVLLPNPTESSYCPMFRSAMLHSFNRWHERTDSWDCTNTRGMLYFTAAHRRETIKEKTKPMLGFNAILPNLGPSSHNKLNQPQHFGNFHMFFTLWLETDGKAHVLQVSQ